MPILFPQIQFQSQASPVNVYAISIPINAHSNPSHSPQTTFLCPPYFRKFKPLLSTCMPPPSLLMRKLHSASANLFINSQYTDNHNLQRGYSTEYSSKIQIHRLIVLTSVVHRWQAYTTLTRPISVFSVLVEEYPACRNPAHPVHNPDWLTVCVTPSNAESFLQCRSSGEHGQLACRSMRSLQRTWHFLFYRLTTLIIHHSLTFSPRA